MPWWFWPAAIGVVFVVVTVIVAACAVIAGAQADRLFENARRRD